MLERSNKHTPTNSNPSQDEHTAPSPTLIATIVNYFTSEPRPTTIAEASSVTPDQLQTFRSALKNHQISDSDLESFLNSLPAPSATPAAMFKEITQNTREKQILALLTGHTKKNWQKVNTASLESLLDAPKKGRPDYRTPLGFSSLREEFLDSIRSEATPEQFNDYIDSLDHLETILFGDRFTYYQQFKLLEASTLRKNNSASEASKASEAPSSTSEPTSPAPLPSANLSPLAPEERASVLSRCVFEGDAWMQGGQEYHLSSSNLLSADLPPAFSVLIADQTFYFSETFSLADNNLACLAFIPAGEAIKVRSFYRKQTEGLWHYLPDYIRQNDGNGFGWYGDSYSNSATILPLDLQRALSELANLAEPKSIPNTNPDFLFAGTATAYNTRQEYRDALKAGQLRGDFYREVSSTPLNAEAEFLGPNRRKSAPQLISVNANMAPDLDSLSFNFSSYSSLVGPITASVFPSHDHAYNWLFFSDYRGRAWIGQIEVVSPLTSTGCYRDWINPTDIATPLYEYSTRSSGYGDPTDTRKGYTCMWNNYLSKIPLLEDFLKHRQS